MTETKHNPLDLAKMVQENTQPRLETIKAGDIKETPILLIPNGMRAESVKKYLDEHLQKPRRRKGTIHITRLPSLIDIINRYKSAESALFASAAIDEKSIYAHIRAIFNYNPQGSDNNNADNNDHSAIYNFPVSNDFKHWISNNQKPMSQLEFALFLEERINELAAVDDSDMQIVNGLKPKFADPLQILELSRSLEIYAEESFVSKNKLSSGETELKFTSEHVNAKGKPLSIPDFFVVRVPLFEGDAPQRILARLRYRKKDSVILWFYDLYRIDTVLNTAFEAACTTVSNAVAMPLYFGASEGQS